ncbi:MULTISPECIES: hypothetical protein [Natrialbaceae]|uniref:hypothetical protein n=1 Tax=Natrialbaceae TaxID=1644061 RepID=UPI00207C2D95|nr:hypothetical protein [Natronococcus sp. CG52]
MTDSATDDTAGDGGLEVGSSLDELFGPVAEEPLDERPVGRDPSWEASGNKCDDETATAVFDRLKTDSAADADAVLADDRPTEIIASADESEPPTDETALDAALLVDEDALEALLLPDRTEGEEFRWVDTGDAPLEPSADASLAGDGPASEESETMGETLEVTTGADEPAARSSRERAETEAAVSRDNTEQADPAAERDDAASSESGSVGSGPLDLASVESEAASRENSLVVPTESELATTEDVDEERSTGILGWLRSKLGLS